jgi:hypothetical protein
MMKKYKAKGGGYGINNKLLTMGWGIGYENLLKNLYI